MAAEQVIHAADVAPPWSNGGHGRPLGAWLAPDVCPRLSRNQSRHIPKLCHFSSSEVSELALLSFDDRDCSLHLVDDLAALHGRAYLDLPAAKHSRIDETAMPCSVKAKRYF